MDTYLFLKWAHILAMAYWLGGEWGVFNASKPVTDINLSLKKVFELELKSVNNKLYNEIEIPLIKVLSNIEREGVSLDTDFLKNLSNTLNQKLKKIEDIIFKKSKTLYSISESREEGSQRILAENLKEKSKSFKLPPKPAL